MFAQRCLLVLVSAGLLAISACKKSEPQGNTPPSSPSNHEDPTIDAKELADARQASVNNLRQLGTAMYNYEAALQVFPTPGYDLDKKPKPDRPSDPISWRVKLLPYIEQNNLSVQVVPPLPIPASVANTVIPTYANPLKKKNATPQTHYRVFVGGGAIFDPKRATRITDITDGTSNTILIVESAEPVDWSKPEDFLFDPAKPLPKLGIFPGGFHALMADGSVRWIPADTPEATIKAMITRAGNDYVEPAGVYIEDRKEGAPIERPSGNKAKSQEEPKPPPQANQPKKDGEVEKIREAAAKLRSSNNLKQIAIAILNHEAAYAKFPSPGVPKGVTADKGISSPHSWRVAILPFIEQEAAWKLIPNNGQGAIPKQVSDLVIKVYLSPLAKDPKPHTNYRVFVGNGAAFEWGKSLKIADFTDGLSNTILAVECADPIDWTSIDDFHYDPKKPLPKLGGVFEGGFHAVMADGAVKWVPASTPEATIRAMITRNGGEIVQLP
jgi:hypothetical protein